MTEFSGSAREFSPWIPAFQGFTTGFQEIRRKLHAPPNKKAAGDGRLK
jgi:hypothetical protein